MGTEHTQQGEPPPRSIAHALFETAALPEAERFDVWHDSVLPLFESWPDQDQLSPAGFSARVESFDLESMYFGTSAFSALRFHRGRDYGEGADHLLVQLYLSGGYVGYNGDREMQVRRGDISLIDLGRPLETRAVASNCLSLVVPRELMFSLLDPARLSHGRVLTAASPTGRILGDHLQTVWQNLPHASVAELATINRMLIATVAGAFAGDGPGLDEGVAAMERASLEAIRVYIERNLETVDLTPEHLCLRFHCSRGQLYRLFGPWGGVARYVRQARLRRCMEELSSVEAAQKRIIDVALRWRFTSQSHFCRLFRQTYGMSPSDAVERGRAYCTGPVPQERHADARVNPAFHRWLRQL